MYLNYSNHFHWQLNKCNEIKRVFRANSNCQKWENPELTNTVWYLVCFLTSYRCSSWRKSLYLMFSCFILEINTFPSDEMIAFCLCFLIRLDSIGEVLNVIVGFNTYNLISIKSKYFTSFVALWCDTIRVSVNTVSCILKIIFHLTIYKALSKSRKNGSNFF